MVRVEGCVVYRDQTTRLCSQPVKTLCRSRVWVKGVPVRDTRCIIYVSIYTLLCCSEPHLGEGEEMGGTTGVWLGQTPVVPPVAYQHPMLYASF